MNTKPNHIVSNRKKVNRREEWEEDFDLRFTERGNYVYQAEIKDFISDLLTQANQQAYERAVGVWEDASNQFQQAVTKKERPLPWMDKLFKQALKKEFKV